MPFCPACGKPVGDSDTFCNSCGKALNKSDRQGLTSAAINVSTSAPPAVISQTASSQGAAAQVKYCQVCGHLNPAGVMYCQQCGSNQFGPNPPARIQRPTGVTIIGIVQIIFAIVDFFITLFVATFILLFAPGIVILLLAISLLPLFFAIAFLTGRNWGRILMMIGAVLELFVIPVGTIIGIVLLYYLTRPRVVAYFKQPR